MTFRLLFFLPFLTVPSLPASGQTPEIKTQIVTLSLDKEVEEVFYLNDGKALPFHSKRSGFGEPMPYTGPQQFALRGSAGEFAAKPPLPAPLASVLLPAQAKTVLLVTSHTPEDKIKLEAYNISAANFRAGDYRVFNFSEKSVLLILGKAKFGLKPGEDFIVSDTGLQEKPLDVVVQLAQIDDGEPKRVYASVWGHQPTKRNYVFLFKGSHATRPIGIRRFADYPE